MSRKRIQGGPGSPAVLANVWTKAELAALRERYGKAPVAAVAAELGRSKAAVMQKANRLGLKAKRRWTRGDDETLAAMWDEEELGNIARVLKRSRATIYWRAEKLGLDRGCPEGYEYLRNAAKRVGYEVKTLKRILAAAGVSTRRSNGRPTRKRAVFRFRIVESEAVDRAVTEWLKNAPVNAYASEAGLDLSTLKRWLQLGAQHLKIEIPPPPAKAKHVWRVPEAAVQAVLEWRSSLESVAAAARRLRVCQGTLRARLRRAEVHMVMVGRTAYVPKSLSHSFAKKSS